MFIVTVSLGIFTLGFGYWIGAIIFSFIYNKIYIKELIEKGYRPASEESRRKLETGGIPLKNAA